MSDEFVTRAVRCPVCQTAFNHDQPTLTALAGRDADFRPLFTGRDVLLGMVMTCPTCRYSAFAEGFESEGDLGEEERALLLESGDDAPVVHTELPGDDELDGLRRFLKRPETFDGLQRDGEPYGGARCVLAARCHEFLDEDDVDGVLELYLRGSWCARATHDRDIEQRCQREVVARLRKRLDEKDEKKKLHDADRPRAVYLWAELSRRLGEFSAALQGFEELRGLVDAEDEEGSRWLERARRLGALAGAKSDVNAPWTDEPLEDE